MEFDPNDTANVAAAAAAAAAAQALSNAIARAMEGDTLPEPPNGLPSIKSTKNGQVLGYRVTIATVHDCIRPDGTHAYPGDAGFYDAQCGRLGLHPMPAGWMFESRQAHKLLAIVTGNPILLEEDARALGYVRSFATAPNILDLGEIEL